MGPPSHPAWMGPLLERSRPRPPTFMGICSELENLSMREELPRADMPCHPTCKRTALCPLSARLTWGELTSRSITSPRCFMTGWARDWGVWGEPLLTLEGFADTALPPSSGAPPSNTSGKRICKERRRGAVKMRSLSQGRAAAGRRLLGPSARRLP